jgi:hypothetical protein
MSALHEIVDIELSLLMLRAAYVGWRYAEQEEDTQLRYGLKALNGSIMALAVTNITSFFIC